MHPNHALRAAILGGTLVLCGAAQAAAQTPIRPGQTVNGALEASDPKLEDDTHYDAYRFTGRAGQRVEIVMNAEGFDAFLSLGRIRDGEFESSRSDDDSGGGTNARLRYTLPADGEYVIHANSIGEATGDYTLALNEIEASPAPTASPIRVGQTVNGTLAASDARLETDDTYYDLHQFTGRAGQRVEIVMRSSDFDPYLGLGTMDGDEFDLLDSDDDGAGGTDAKIGFTLREAGTYYIRANALSQGETGAYTLSLAEVQRTPEPAPAAIRVGATVNGELAESDAMADDDSYFDAYVFTARAGEVVTVDMASEAFDTYLAVGTVERGVWTMLESNDDFGEETDSRVVFTAPAAGRYVIRANSLSAGNTGAYTLRLTSGSGGGK